MLTFSSDQTSYFLPKVDEEILEELMKGKACLKSSKEVEGCFLVLEKRTLRLRCSVSTNTFMAIRKNQILKSTDSVIFVEGFDVRVTVKRQIELMPGSNDLGREELITEILKRVPASIGEIEKEVNSVQNSAHSWDTCSFLLSILLELKKSSEKIDRSSIEKLLSTHPLPAGASQNLAARLLEQFCRTEGGGLRWEAVFSLFWRDLTSSVSSMDLPSLISLFNSACKHYLPSSLPSTDLINPKNRKNISLLLQYGLLIDYNDYSSPSEYNPKRVVFKKICLSHEDSIRRRLKAIYQFKKTLTQQEAVYFFKEFIPSSADKQNFFQRYFIKFPYRIHPVLRNNFLLANPLVEESALPLVPAKSTDQKSQLINFEGMMKIKILWI